MDTRRELFSYSSQNASSLGKDHNIKVVVRVRPLNEIEIANGRSKCIQCAGGDSNSIVLKSKDSKQYTFDLVAN